MDKDAWKKNDFLFFQNSNANNYDTTKSSIWVINI